MAPMLFKDPTESYFVAVVETERGYALSGYNPQTKKAVYGFEETDDAAFGWVEGLKLVFLDGGAVQ